MIGIIDFGSGNKLAILDIFSRLSIPAKLVSTPNALHDCEKLILPGVGAFDEAMRRLNSSGLREGIEREVIKGGKAILGICVGMQIMAKGSDEGKEPGLGWFDAFTRKFDSALLKGKPKLPHLGWNKVVPAPNAKLFPGIDGEKGFYFLHSYYVSCENEADVAASTTYGNQFASAIQKGKCFGCQFHPEKSHFNGLKVFENFAKLT
jgi:glutamine amidotransferase